jgi:uncharacterized membrane protein YraQ (UPF0718 family)
MDVFAPLQWLSDWLVYGVFSVEKGTKLGESLDFFLYDSLKIVIMLLVINYLMAIVRHYLPIEKIRDFLTSRKWYGFDYFLAAFLGLITPFCSCSSIPLFVGFLGAGIPLGVTLTFLIASPLLSETAIILLWGVIGAKVAVIYIISGLLVSMAGGFLLRRVNPEKHISPDVLALSREVKRSDIAVKKFRRAFLAAWLREAWGISKKLIPYILIGVGVGAAIHNLVPADYLENALGSGAWWSVPLAAVVSIPVYANAVGVIPIVEALIAKGVAIGTAMVVLMATIGLSLPEALILKKVMSTKLLVAFFGIVSVGIVTIGYVLNALFH